MEGRIYITGTGTDPGLGHNLNDPMLTETPTLGACMPNIRRAINIGDYIFVVSGKTSRVQQYVIGGFQVAEKISALEAFARFPNYRLYQEGALVKGNIIVNADGSRHRLDHHNDDRTGFIRRIGNYIVGKDLIVMETAREIAMSRKLTLPMLSNVFGKTGKRVIDIIGRNRKLSTQQTQQIIAWLRTMKDSAAQQ